MKREIYMLRDNNCCKPSVSFITQDVDQRNVQFRELTFHCFLQLTQTKKKKTNIRMREEKCSFF